jgi:uncharacterized protein with HEPN domain
MKSNIGDKQRLQHILQAINDIESFTTGISYDEYAENYMLRLAVVKLFEMIGEASGHLSDNLKEEFSEVEWTVLKGMRNIFVHEYFGIDYEIIWNSVQENLPTLKEKIQKIISVKYPD